MTTSPLSDVLLDELTRLVKGDVFADRSTRLIYSTDASAYQEMPLAVVRPRDVQDLRLLVSFARRHQLPLIPRGAGTSLAGQVVGRGIVVDVSFSLNKIIDINPVEKWVMVEPGVVLDELNLAVKSHGLFFGPETSTSNRCTLGGMVGNNSCGSHSLVYGSTRDHLIEVHGVLSSGDEVVFRQLTPQEWAQKCRLNTHEGSIYRFFKAMLDDADVATSVQASFPHPSIHRRNTGYAIDLLFGQQGGINLSALMAGSEGTLFMITRVKLGLVPLPPPVSGLVCAHFATLHQAIEANLVALNHHPVAVELMDKKVLDLTLDNIVQRQNRFFIEGDPQALLIVELVGQSVDEVREKAQLLTADFQSKQKGYAWPLLMGRDIRRVWDLRKAGLGVLSNMPGDDLPVPVIEDTAVRVEDMAAYLADINQMLTHHGRDCVFYGHIGSGELHLRPVLNMKQPDDVRLFRRIATDTAAIVKKYRGSLSGEHGDGRLRGEFIPSMVGEQVYALFRQVKEVFDPKNIFNPGKIIDTPPMDQHLRYRPITGTMPDSLFSWASTGGWVQAIERCNGSADCRKSSIMGGTMCPSFMADRNEKDSTRARANLLRHYFTGSIDVNKQGMAMVLDVLDLCLSCKACKAECPSNVDMAKLKAEFLHQYHQAHGASLRDRVFARQPQLFRVASMMPSFYNFLIGNRMLGGVIASVLHLNPDVKLPQLSDQTLRKWFKTVSQTNHGERCVCLFADEFTNFTDNGVGKKAVMLLQQLGYHVMMPAHAESGRTWLSKGFLDKARAVAEKNVSLLSSLVGEDVPLVGIEPSAILTFRDEYPDLVSNDAKEAAQRLALHVYTIEEFLWCEMEAGRIQTSQFTDATAHIRYHAHCYQKVLSDASLTQKILSFPVNYTAEEIASGCCGMAGSFGYEAEHAAMARRIGELKLFPAVRQTSAKSLIAAAGTSCRGHIRTHTGREVVHPVEVLFDACLPLKGSHLSD